MRRSFSTINLARDPKATQAIMGHAKLDMTANVYAQSLESKVIELLDRRWLTLGFGQIKSVQ
jgi:integrase